MGKLRLHKLCRNKHFNTRYDKSIFLGGTQELTIRGAGSIVWGLGFWLGKDILGFFKNIDLDNI